MQKRQRRRLHVNDTDVPIRVQVADTDGHHRHPRPAQVAEAGVRAVMHAVAEHHHSGRWRVAVVVEHLGNGADQVRPLPVWMHLRQVFTRQHPHRVVELVQRDVIPLRQLVQRPSAAHRADNRPPPAGVRARCPQSTPCCRRCPPALPVAAGSALPSGSAGAGLSSIIRTSAYAPNRSAVSPSRARREVRGPRSSH